MKTRLTITLPESTLQRIDLLIDKKKIRNRSHAIEFLLEQSLLPHVNTAVILAGGPVSPHQTFKPLALFHGTPVIEYTLDRLKKFGIQRVIITTNHQGKELEKKLGTGQKMGLALEYVYEPEPLGTAGALRALQDKVGNQPFVVISGDVITDINLHDMVEFHTQNQALITMAVKPRTTKASYDNVFLQGHTVVDFQRSQPNQTVSLVNAGVYLVDPAALDLFPLQTPSMLEKEVFPRLTHSHRLLAFPFQGLWLEVDS